MPLSGKYDFSGIKKFGVKGLSLALSSVSWIAFLIKWGFGPVITFGEEFAINWLANKGLMLLDIGAIYVEGEFQQSAFDKAMGEGIKKVLLANGTLTPEQIKEIDDKVIAAADNFLPYTKPH